MQPQSPLQQAPGGVDSGQVPALPSVPVPGQAMSPVQPQAAPQLQAAVPQAAPSQEAPAMADDGDLIEKEWVAKVKQVVHGTAHDPYELNRQFTKLKADYMQKRYGKSIKLDD